MPGSLRFLLILSILGSLVYGGLYVLATLKPEQGTVVKKVPVEHLVR